MPVEPTPLHMPTRAELWRRNQLALSVLGHRPYDRDTADLIGRVLRGETADRERIDR